jgi:Sec-independent protein translocase protein TatA
MFGSFGMLEILLILIVGVVVFGAIRLPRLARSISSGWSELKRLKRGFDLGFDEREEQHAQSHGPARHNQPYHNGNSGPQDSTQGYAQEQQPYQTGNQYYEQEPPSTTPQDDSTEKSENNEKNT